MALPQLNTAPKYQLSLPSNGQIVKYRPFVVREEKALMIAMEGKDVSSMLMTLTDVIDSCTDLDGPSKNLPSFDIEYLMLKIRAKSVGETAKIALKCDKCDHSNEMEVDLDSIEMTMPEVDKKPELSPGVTLELEWPSYSSLIDTTLSEASSQTEQLMNVVKSCIAAVCTEEERILSKDISDSELANFLDSMNNEQFDKVRKFVENLPKLEHTFEFECGSCSEHNSITVEGVTNFLS